jgi:Na+/H+-dicarboxylate symporter
MGRTATNVLGNAIATAAVGKWEKAIDPVNEALDDVDEVLPEPQGAAVA